MDRNKISFIVRHETTENDMKIMVNGKRKVGNILPLPPPAGDIIARNRSLR